MTKQHPYYFIFDNDQLLVSRAEKNPLPSFGQLIESGIDLNNAYLVGFIDETPCYTLSIESGTSLTQELSLENLRQVYILFDEKFLMMAMKAKQIAYWQQTQQFCGQCGNNTQFSTNEFVAICKDCNLFFYPRLSPCIIVLITRGDKILLGRSPHFRPGIYSLIAGFVEVGESIEQAVHREVLEEVGVTITNLRYHSSQSWPFPHSLMLGFTAEYASGEIVIDKNELEDAQWFHIDELPPKPFPLSIARKILDNYVNHYRKDSKTDEIR